MPLTPEQMEALYADGKYAWAYSPTHDPLFLNNIVAEAVAKEREACVQVIEYWVRTGHMHPWTAQPLIQMIRARGEPASPSTEIRDCGCEVTKGWRCPMHDGP